MIDHLKVDIEKHTYESLRKIKELDSEKALKLINKSKNIDSIITIEKEQDCDYFKCKLFLETPIFGLEEFKDNILEEDESMSFYQLGNVYNSDYNSIIKVNFPFKIPQIFKLYLSKVYTGSLENYDNKFQRLMIPLEKEFDIHMMTTKSVKYDEKVVFQGIIEVNINLFNYHIFLYSNNESKQFFLIIDGLEKQSFINFKNSCEAILISLGFLTGNLILHQYYFLTSEDHFFNKVENIFFQKNKSNIFSNNRIIDQSRFLDYLRQIEQETKYKPWVKPMPKNTFDNLCSTVLNNSIYARCCQIITEADQTKHDLLKAGIFSIALETISGLIYEDNKEKINPIQDKGKARLIRHKLQKALEEFNQKIPEEALKIYTAKINELNKPTNSKKLSYPFQLYKIKLSVEEIEILNHRNKFLHGTSPFEETELIDKKYELKFIIAHLKFMINCLMLKYVGYSGHIVNNPGFMEYNTKKTVSNHLFKII